MEEFKILECQFEKPKYSIVIPTFKRSDMLKKAVDAALRQKNIFTYEVLVMDNNPERDDATEALMMEYKDNPKVSYYKNYKNLGSTGNWNKMFKMAKGDYIITCHDDDLLMPFYLEVMECFIESTNKGFGIVVPMLYYSKDHILPDIQIPTTNFVNYNLFKPQYMILSQIGLPTGILVKRSVFFKAG
jgi:glycosyltransferase involved in cell wall biosynthesis